MRPLARSYSPREIIQRREQARELAARTRAVVQTELTQLNQEVEALTHVLRGLEGAVDPATLRSVESGLQAANARLHSLTEYAGFFVEAHGEQCFFERLAAIIHIDTVA